uniref:Gremlin-like 1 n=1 Tax=Hydra vulgaris TaxID=6087 RepID=Q2A124_HYDVU|nr:Gremlin-like 1 precursor [Hydra vulgaris]
MFLERKMKICVEIILFTLFFLRVVPLNLEESQRSVTKDNHRAPSVDQGKSSVKKIDPGYMKDECGVFPFNQTVTKNGCEGKYVANNFCFGQCGSFIIPYYNITNKKISRLTLENCKQCVPEDFELTKIPIYCPERKKKHQFAKVLLIKKCVCKKNSCLMT